MRFSILIPTFNRAALLGQSIESALAQTHANREIVVIDDGSAEDTKGIVAKFGSSVRYLRQNHQGKASALNNGIESTRGDIIVVLDDDDLFPPWTLAKHAEALTHNPHADFSYGRFRRFKGEALPSSSEFLEEETVPTDDPRRLVIKLMENCFLPNPTWAVRREAQTAAGPYDESLRFSEDYDMVLRCARRNEGVFVNDCVLYQRKHESRRGSILENAVVTNPVDKWLKYDKLIFESIAKRWCLHEFRPFLEFEADGRACALLQKGVILFQRKVYDDAMRTLDEYRHELGIRPPDNLELQIAIGLFGCRYGIADLTTPGDLGASVTAWLRATQWPMVMKVALASQLRWRTRSALAAGHYGAARDITRFSCAGFGALATALAVLGSRHSSAQKRWRDLQISQ